MKIERTPLEGCIVVTPQVFGDNRGEFVLNFNKREFEAAIGHKINFVIENQSTSKYGVIRGLHLQEGEHVQAKLIRVSQGKILDVVVDFRKDSPTYGKHFSIILTKENKKQLFVPRGFLHGFSVLEDDSTVVYKCDNYYNPESEFGIIYNDPSFDIDWKLKEEDIDLSNKDSLLESFLNT
jgi:dTDP-4-dehydrorhamnose 3,5-epimerase